MTTHTRSSLARPPATLGARFLGEAAKDPIAAHKEAYAAWRAEMVDLIADDPSNRVTFTNNLAAADRMHQAILSGGGDEVLVNGKTRWQQMQMFMDAFRAALSDKVPTIWDLLAEAVVNTAKGVKAAVVKATEQVTSKTSLLSWAVIIGGGAYLAASASSLADTLSKPFRRKQ